MTTATINRRGLIQTLKRITRTTERHTWQPASFCHCELNGAALFQSTDFGAATMESVPHGEKTGEDVSILLDPREMIKAAEQFKGAADVRIRIDGGECFLESGGAFKVIRTFPNLLEQPDGDDVENPDYETARVFTGQLFDWTSPPPVKTPSTCIDARELEKGLRLTVFATDEKCSRYTTLGGVRFEFMRNKGRGRLIGTDGRRLAVYTIGRGNPKASPKCIAHIPAKFCEALIQALPSAETVTVLFEKDRARFELINEAGELFCTMRTKTLEGRFPKWESVLPQPRPRTAALTVESVLPIVEQCGAFSDEWFRGIDIELSPGLASFTMTKPVDRWNCNTQGPQLGIRETLNLAGDVRPDSISLDAIFLRDAFRAMKQTGCNGGKVEAFIDGPEFAAVFTSGRFYYLVMPLARNDKR